MAKIILASDETGKLVDLVQKLFPAAHLAPIKDALSDLEIVGEITISEKISTTEIFILDLSIGK